MKKVMILAMVLGMLVNSCATQVRTTCKIHPELNLETQVNVGQNLIQKEGCASRGEWHGLLGGGMVTITECGSSELIYLGRVTDNIRIGYREFIHDIVRPSYSMEVTYPAKIGRLIFRNTTLEILEIGGDYILYKLISTPTEKCESVYYY